MANPTVPDCGMMLEAIRCLEAMVVMYDSCRWHMEQASCDYCIAQYERVLNLVGDIEATQLPKLHGMAHPVVNAAFPSNPVSYVNWLSGAMNKAILNPTLHVVKGGLHSKVKVFSNKK